MPSQDHIEACTPVTVKHPPRVSAARPAEAAPGPHDEGHRPPLLMDQQRPPGQEAKAAEAGTWAGGTRVLHRRSPGMGAATGLAYPRPRQVLGRLARSAPRLGRPGRMVAVTGPSALLPQASVLEAVLERITS
jgi:hypothetical protein